MKTVFVNTGLDDYLAEKIRKGRIHDNVQERLPTQKVEVKTLYKALMKGESLLSGFKMPTSKQEELRRALEVVSEAIAEEENRKDFVVTEKELIQALDILTAIAREQKG